MTSVGAVLDRNKGVGPGFDALRVALALSVVLDHCLHVTQGPRVSTGGAWLLVDSILPMFFALSGFLITASAQRLPIGQFLLNRGMRIFPALFVEITLSAIILGALVTTAPLADYFRSPEFFGYFANIIGWIHYTLPGVFLELPRAGVVNLSLWTIPWELLCYLLMTIAIVWRLIFKPRLIAALAFAAVMAPLMIHLVVLLLAQIPASDELAARLLNPALYYSAPAFPISDLRKGTLVYWAAGNLMSWQFRVIPFFLAGSAFYLYRHRIPYSPPAAVVICATVLAASLGLRSEGAPYLLNILLCPALVYVVAVVGAAPVPPLPVFRHGDYSYGIYLYGFPIQQMVVRSGADHLSWQLNALISIPLITLFAMFSWHMIELPILRRRRHISGLFERFGGPRTAPEQV